MSKRRIARRQIAAAHLQSTERGARLLAASDGDAEHAERIDRVLEDLREHALGPPLAPVVHLPRPYDYECDVDESAGLRELSLADKPRTDLPLSAMLVGAGFGIASWIVLAAIAFGIYELVGAIA